MLSIVVIHYYYVYGFHELNLDCVDSVEAREEGLRVLVDMLIVLLEDTFLGQKL